MMPGGCDLVFPVNGAAKAARRLWQEALAWWPAAVALLPDGSRLAEPPSENWDSVLICRDADVAVEEDLGDPGSFFQLLAAPNQLTLVVADKSSALAQRLATVLAKELA